MDLNDHFLIWKNAVKGHEQGHKENPCFSTTRLAKMRKSPIPGIKSFPQRKSNKMHRLQVLTISCV